IAILPSQSTAASRVLLSFPTRRSSDLVGLSPITKAALTIGVGLAAQRFGATWFRDGMVPAALLTNEAEVPKELAELVKEMWRDEIGRAHAELQSREKLVCRLLLEKNTA